MYIENFKEFNPSEHYEIFIVYDKDSINGRYFAGLYDKMDEEGVCQFYTSSDNLDEVLKEVKDYIKEIT